MSAEILFLKSEDELLAYCRRFLKDKPKAVQFDGSTRVRRGSGPVAVFRFSLDGRKYKLLGDVSRKAIEEFVAIADEHGSAALALQGFEKGEVHTLILSTHQKPDGWHCLPFSEKAQDHLKRAA